MAKINFKFFRDRLAKDQLFKKLSREGIQRDKTAVNMDQVKFIKLPPASNDYYTFYPGPPADSNDYMATANIPLTLAIALDWVDI
jgi:hypothetical protein